MAWAPELSQVGTGLNDGAFALIAEYAASHFWFQSRNALIVWALTRYFPGFASFLEIGCGTGVVLASVRTAFPHAALTGTEVSPTGLTVAASRVPGARLQQMDGRYLPFEEEFDVIGAFDVLEHIPEDGRSSRVAASSSQCPSTRGCGARSTTTVATNAGIRDASSWARSGLPDSSSSMSPRS